MIVKLFLVICVTCNSCILFTTNVIMLLIACIMIVGKRVLYNVDKIKKYLDAMEV